MSIPSREVMAEVFEFVLSIFIISVSVFLLYCRLATELASGLITMITVYWFQKRSNDSAVQTLLRQSPTIVPILNENHTTAAPTLIPMPAVENQTPGPNGE